MPSYILSLYVNHVLNKSKFPKSWIKKMQNMDFLNDNLLASDDSFTFYNDFQYIRDLPPELLDEKLGKIDRHRVRSERQLIFKFFILYIDQRFIFKNVTNDLAKSFKIKK